jgi:hypothetical protein
MDSYHSLPQATTNLEASRRAHIDPFVTQFLRTPQSPACVQSPVPVQPPSMPAPQSSRIGVCAVMPYFQITGQVLHYGPFVLDTNPFNSSPLARYIDMDSDWDEESSDGELFSPIFDTEEFAVTTGALRVSETPVPHQRPLQPKTTRKSKDYDLSGPRPQATPSTTLFRLDRTFTAGSPLLTSTTIGYAQPTKRRCSTKAPDVVTARTATKRTKRPGVHWTDKVIRQMMFVSGETGEPSSETTILVEAIIQQQVKELVSHRITQSK